MAATRKLPPSPVRTGLFHAGISFLTFAGITAVLATAIQMGGNKELATPKQVVGLFNANPSHDTVKLKERLPGDLTTDHKTGDDAHDTHDETKDPNLGVADLDHTDKTHIVDEKKTDDHGDDDAGDTASHKTVDSKHALLKAPIDGVWEWGSNGRMPKIADDGRTPLNVYKRPFSNPAGRPTISVVMGGLGLNRRVTQSAIDELPPEVTLSFVPYSRGLQEWVDKARAAGHEVMIELPMEPYDYPNNDTGPYTLLTSANAAENRRRTEWLLSQATGYFGVTNYQGAKYATDTRAISPVFDLLKARGLSFVHDGSAPRSMFETVATKSEIPFADAARVIDSEPTASAIDEQLLHLEAIALQTGRALGTGFAFPITVDQLRDWTQTLSSKGYVLAPASSILRAPPSYPQDTGSTKVKEEHSEGGH